MTAVLEHPLETPAGLPPVTPRCPVCHASNWRNPLKATRLRRCEGCDTYLNDRSSSRVEEESLYDHGESFASRDTEAVAAVQWEWLSHLIPDRARPRVLDIGCGGGSFLAAAREAGAEVQGLELDPMGIRAARERGISVTAGSLFDEGVPKGPWDAITFWDVLDHLEWPDQALQLATAGLAPGGLLAVRGRNARFHVPLKKSRSGSPELHRALRLPDVSVVHRWGLSPQGWGTLLTRAGLTQVTLSPGIPTPGDRYSNLGGRAAFFKKVTGTTGDVLRVVSRGRAYLYPSVLAYGFRSR